MASVGVTAARPDRAATQRSARDWASYALVPATIVAILGVSLLVLMTPLWTHLALSTSGATVPGGVAGDAQAVSDRTVGVLLLGGSFSAVLSPAGTPMYTADEAAHLDDVRLVLFLFLGMTLLAGGTIIAGLWRAPENARRWRAIARGGALLTIAVFVLGVIGALAFGIAFEVFHQLLFPGGNWAFPADSNLIRLYPYGFWQTSAFALGLLAGAAGAFAWYVGGRRAARIERALYT
jgi:hypothetical protein